MDVDLTDAGMLLRPDLLDDPRPFYDQLRAAAPVWQIPGQNTFLVSDPALVRDAVGRPEDFSSNLVSLLHDDGTGCPVAYPMAPFGDPVHVLPTADPPLHTRHRKLLQSHLSPATVAELEPAITGIVDELLSAVIGTGTVEVVSAFTDAVPARTICELIGLPSADVPLILDLVGRTGALLDGVTDAAGMHDAMHAAIALAVHVQEAMDTAIALPVAERRGLLAVFADAIEAGDVDVGEVRDMLVVLSSVVGRMALPFFGPYNAAKFAVEGLAETYRSELSSLGIETCVVEPGAYPTSFIDALMPSSDRSRHASYGDMVHAPRTSFEAFEGAMASSPAQDPQNVADAIVALVDTPAGERPFRTVVDSMGMADAIAPYNDAAEQVTAAIYGAFGMGYLLTVNTGGS